MNEQNQDSFDKRIAFYQAGYSLREVAAMTNYSKSAVHYHLKANGIELRPPGKNREKVKLYRVI
jgi:predicted DNA-binding protein YlxM (UPF0122 family)